MTGYSEDEGQFDRETASVIEPEDVEIIPPGATEPDAQEFEMPLSAFITEELAAAILSLPANLMARKTGREWWRLEKEEEDLLGKASAPCLRFLVESYLGSGVGPFAGIGAALGVIYAPRILHQVQVIKQEKKKRARGEVPQQQQPQTQESYASSEGAGAASQRSSSDYQTAYDD